MGATKIMVIRHAEKPDSSAGSATDLIGRLVAERMRASLDNPSSSRTSAGASVPAGLCVRDPTVIRLTSVSWETMC
jgi:hypothetical protein